MNLHAYHRWLQGTRYRGFLWIQGTEDWCEYQLKDILCSHWNDSRIVLLSRAEKAGIEPMAKKGVYTDLGTADRCGYL